MKRVTFSVGGVSLSQGGSEIWSASSLMEVSVSSWSRSIVVGGGTVAAFAEVEMEVLAPFVDAPFVVGVLVGCVAGRC